MTTKTIRRKYTDDFKREALAVVTEQGYGISQAARSLGVNANLIHKWKQQQLEQTSGTRLSQEERDELVRLRRENRELRMEKEILKKASAYFAKEMK